MDNKFLKANQDNFVSAYDKLKMQGSIITNSFFDMKLLNKYFNEKECLLCSYEKAFFLLIPFYNYYEVQYYALSKDDLQLNLNNLKANFQNKTLKLRLVTKNEEIENDYTNTFESIGFKRQGRIIRTVSESLGILKYLDCLKELIKSIPKEYSHVGYAKVEDAKEILAFLKTEFDEVLDSLPELDELEDNLSKKQVVVVKDDKGHVLSLRYFTVEKNICNLIYEVTKKEYRKLGLFYEVIVFFTEENLKKHVDFKKIYGWRNAERTQLLKFSKSMDEAPDGTVICVFAK